MCKLCVLVSMDVMPLLAQFTTIYNCGIKYGSKRACPVLHPPFITPSQYEHIVIADVMCCWRDTYGTLYW